MAKEERCPKNPSMPRAYCSHCQGTGRGTADNPNFSVRPSFYIGSPVVEVLKDGGPVHSYDSNFRFGLRKAQMLIGCVAALREFWQASEPEKLTFGPRLVVDATSGLRVHVFVEMHPDFETSTGTFVDRPWLRLTALPPDKEHIGLGVIKCRAICAVQQELKRWLRQHGIDA